MKQMCIFLIYGLISFFLQNPLLAQNPSGDCGTPKQLEVTVTGNQVNFSWTGTDDADIHVILLYNKTTNQNDKGFSMVENSLSTTSIPNGSYRWRVISLCNTRNSLTDHSDWIWGEDFDFSGNCLPSRANAGADQLNNSGSSTVLAAVNPTIGAGTWTIVSGIGGSFGNINNATSIFTGFAGNTYVLRWTVSNECDNYAYDDVIVSFCIPPSVAYAGPDQQISSGVSTALSASSPTNGTGVWTIVSGAGGSFSNASSAVSSFTGLAHTTYKLCWTVSNACQNSSDTVMIDFCTPPVNANFVRIGYLPTGDFALKGELAEGEIGTWSVIEGAGGYFSDIHDPESTFRGQLNTPYKIKWTVSNACGSVDSDSATNSIVWKRIKLNNPYLNPNLEYGTVTDREGNEYPTIQIGDQTWMAENLRTNSLNNGVLMIVSGRLAYKSFVSYPNYNIPTVENYYNSMNTVDGGYYSYGAAINTRLCPIGWRVPDFTDGNKLSFFLGGNPNVSGKLKAIGKWGSDLATNESGFSAVPSGLIDGDRYPNPVYHGQTYGSQAGFIINEAWLPPYFETHLQSPLSLRLSNNTLNVGFPVYSDFADLGSCRCIKDDCTRALIADAGQDTLNIRKSNIGIYAGKLPKYGHGEWSIVSGIGGSIIEVPHSNFYQGTRIGFEGTTNTEYVLRWTVSNDCGNSVYDERTVSFCPKLASAGADQSKVTGTITLAATAPEDGTGIWTIVSGIGGSFGNASQPSSTFTGTAGNIYVLRWTVNDKCGSNYDEVIVSYCPQLVSAGADQSKIAGTVTTLAATVPEDGTGIWTIRSGTGGSLSNASQSNSTFTGTAGSTYVLRWTVNDKCGISYDEVSVSYCPKLASAGTDQLEVTGTVTTLAASVPVNGTGAWTIESGIGGSFGNASQPNSTFTGTAGNIYVLRWTVSNVCGSNYDEVTVSFMPVSVTDIDGNQYGVVKIGNQIWMSENLRTTKYNDGAIIQNVTDNSGWGLQRTGGWSYYNNEVSNNYPYGKLYNWYAVNTGKLCPQGWHIPMDMEWTVLTDYLGGLTVAGGKMKLTTGWNAPNTGATNESGFSGVAGGRRDHLGMFYVLGRASYWWSNTETSESPVTIRQLGSDNSSVIVGNNSNKIHGFSCRCIKD